MISTVHDSIRKPEGWLSSPAGNSSDRRPTRMTRRTRISMVVSATVVIILAAIVTNMFVLRRGAPEEVRLLPDAPAVVYIDLETTRRLTPFKSRMPVQREAQYEEFIRETGFEIERDLDHAAFAIHTGTHGDTRYTEVLDGRYDHAKLSAYLRKLSRNVERYRENDIYEIPVETRTVRVALIGIDLAAISNVDDPGVIHGIIDRLKEIAQPFGGPTVVAEHYREIPLGSLVWAIARIPAAPGSLAGKNPSGGRTIPLPGGFELLIPTESTMVASVRVLGAANARAEFITASDADARRFVEQAGTFLNIFRAVQQSAQPKGSDTDVKAVFDSLKVEQHENRAVISASIPLGFLKKIFSEPPQLGTQPNEKAKEPAQVPEKKPGERTRKQK